MERTKVKLLLDRKSRAEPPPKTRQLTGPHMLRHLTARVTPPEPDDQMSQNVKQEAGT